jgi:putative Holliday junction resolvase
MRYLALDVGDRRVGLAVSDESGSIATPLTVIHRASKAEDFARIALLVREKGVGGLVIGHPLNADGSSGSQVQRIERYTAALAQALRDEGLDLPLAFCDEYLSTQRAQKAMIAAGRKIKDRRAWLDAVAAAVILQDYLDAQRFASSDAVEEGAS